MNVDHDNPPLVFDRTTHYSIDDHDDDDSDDDVFAFLPPSTPDRNAPIPHNVYPPDSLIENLSYPAPVFDPYARYPVRESGPPIVHHRVPYAVETPPSTDSHTHSNDPYRMRRVNHPSQPSTAHSNRINTSTTTSSREIRVSLPSSVASKERPQPPKRHPSSIAESFLTPSMMDEDFSAVSIKYSLPPPYPTHSAHLHLIRMEFDFDTIEEEDSPFPEVRASVSNIDDPDMPALTLRMWFVGLVLCLISS
jgi:hypothetical protein